MASLATYLSVAVATVLWGADFNLPKPLVAETRPLIAAADRFVLGAGARLEVSRGDALMFVACLSWALYNVYLRKLPPKGASALATTTGTMVAGAAALTLVALLSGERFVVPSPYTGSALLMMSVSGGVLAYLLWSAGIARLGPARAAIFMNVVPVASMAISTVSGVPPTPAQLLGGALVIGAVMFSALTGARAKVTTSPCVTSPCA